MISLIQSTPIHMDKYHFVCASEQWYLPRERNQFGSFLFACLHPLEKSVKGQQEREQYVDR